MTNAGPPAAREIDRADDAHDLISSTPPNEWLACGYFTPDYGRWVECLTKSLEQHNAPYHLFATPKLRGGWEINTRAKPSAILRAMARYPDKVIVWLDVDCEVHNDLSPLANLRADVAAYAHTKRSKRRRRVRYNVWSGTMVFRPTPQARAFVEAWCNNADSGPRFDHDQESLLLTLGTTPSVTFEVLPKIWCAMDHENVPNPVILHTSAGGEQFKVSRLLRKVWLR
jgi:hypothetical protein